MWGAVFLNTAEPLGDQPPPSINPVEAEVTAMLNRLGGERDKKLKAEAARWKRATGHLLKALSELASG